LTYYQYFYSAPFPLPKSHVHLKTTKIVPWAILHKLAIYWAVFCL
jgi:hypothetical protein